MDAASGILTGMIVLISESLEDYLETIYALEEAGEPVRVKRIAERRSVRMASVTSALRRLARAGLIDYRAHGSITMTENGRVLAGRIHDSHQTVRDFLLEILCLDSATAERDGCGIEHHVSRLTLKRLRIFHRCLKQSPPGEKQFFQKFLAEIREGEGG